MLFRLQGNKAIQVKSIFAKNGASLLSLSSFITCSPHETAFRNRRGEENGALIINNNCHYDQSGAAILLSYDPEHAGL